MVTTIEFSTILALAGAVTAIGGAWLTIHRINQAYKKDREIESAKILQIAKEEDVKVKQELVSKRELVYNELDSRIEAIKKDLENLRQHVDKDLEHMRETYNGEIRNLGNKIEDLRSDLRTQHGQLIQMLTKMIENKE